MAASPSSASIAAVDLFCGVGGLTYGLRRAGIDVRLGVDIDEECRYPFEVNNDIPFAQKSVCDVTPQEITAAWRGAKYTLLAGCAPCQPFSTYRQANTPSDDHRWPLLREFARLVEKTKPDFVTMENVPRLEDQDVFREFVRSLERGGYKVSASVVDCSDYGVPQQRHRLVLLASRHGPIQLRGRRPASKAPPTVREAIADLPPLKAGERCEADPLHQASSLSGINLARIRASTPGGTWRDWPRDLRAKCHRRDTGRGYASVYGRMAWDEPSPTMTTQFFGFGNGRFGHPDQDRGISLREGALLQSFPKKYEFVRPNEPAHFKIIGRLIGNAVPVKLADAIGRSFVAHANELQGA